MAKVFFMFVETGSASWRNRFSSVNPVRLIQTYEPELPGGMVATEPASRKGRKERKGFDVESALCADQSSRTLDATSLRGLGALCVRLNRFSTAAAERSGRKHP
jgi:hypothetical protein